MTLSLVKTGAVAAVMLFATVSASMAATWAYVDHDSKVRKNHFNVSQTVNWVDEGDIVKVIGHWNNWYKLDIPGTNGWVKASVLDFDYYDDPDPGVQVCFNGPIGQVCLNP